MTTKQSSLVFSTAMHRHIALVEQFGDDSIQAKQSLTVAMHFAPQSIKDDIAREANKMNLLPQVLDNGKPKFSLEDIATEFGISMEQVEKDIHEILSMHQELGLVIN